MSLIDEALQLSPPRELAFPEAEYAERRARLRSALDAAGIDMVYLSSPEAMCWFSGDQAEWYQAQSSSKWPPISGTAFHVDHAEPIHFDTQDHLPRLAYCSVLRDVRWLKETVDTQSNDLMELAVSELAAEGWLTGTVGLELGSYRPNPAVSARFRERLEAAGARVVDATPILRELRRLKSPLEREAVREAYRIGAIGLDAVEAALSPGVTELEVYAELVSAMAKAGGEVAGITLPVISGLKTLSGHALASRKKILDGEMVAVDVCGVMHRYHANLARTFSVGPPSEAVARQARRATDAFEVAARVARPGMPVNEFAAALEEHYRSTGIWEDRWYFGGYEIGLAFPPDWVGEWLWECGTEHGDAVLEPGLVINMESNVVLPDRAGRGMFIETLIVEDDRVDVLGRPDGLIRV